jgi:hypothetical protein
MGFTIEDGSGDGYRAKVDGANRLFVSSISESLEHHTNTIHGDSYNLIFSLTATTSGSCVLYIKNSGDENIIFESIMLRSASLEIVEIKINNVGTPVGGTTATPANLNAGSNRQAYGTFLVGSNITGLTGGITIFRYFINDGGSSSEYNFDQDIILPKNRILSMYFTNSGIQVDGFLSFFFDHLH